MINKIRHMSNKLDIIALYLSDYTQTISGRAIAKNISLSPQAALNNLNQMVRDGILSFSVRGRNKEYAVQLKSLKSRMMIEMAEYYNSLKRLQNSELNVLIEEMIPYCESIILFGSFAEWKEKKESDIDLVIVGKSDKMKIKGIRDKYPREVNIEFISLMNFKKAFKGKKPLALEILKKHILFGNIKPITDIFYEYYTR